MKRVSWIACGVLLLGSIGTGACNSGDDDGASGGSESGGTGSGGKATGGKANSGGTGPSTGGKSSGGAPAGGASNTGGSAGAIAGAAGSGDGGSAGGPPERPSCEEIASVDATDDDFSVTVEGFDSCEPIPAVHTCEGKPFPEGTSPAISWTEGPEGTESYAVVFKDITILATTDPSNAMIYNRGYHWAMWDIPADTTELPAELGEGYNSEDVEGAVQWANFKDYSFFGPCPNFDPANPGSVEDSYSFTVYALPVTEAVIPAITGSTVRAMDDYFKSIALAVTEYRGTSDAQANELDPGLFPPTAVAPCPSVGEGPDGCLEKD